MPRPKDEDVEQPDPTGVQHAAGRVEFDSRGNSVWKWAKDVIDSTSILLKRLDNKDLALEPTQKVPVMGGKAETRGGKTDPRGGQIEPRAGKADLRGTTASKRGATADKHGGKRAELDLSERPAGGFDPYNSRR